MPHGRNVQLTKFLDENKLSQRKFSRLIGVNPRTVNRWILGLSPTTEPARGLIQLLIERPELLRLLEVRNEERKKKR